MKIRSVLFIVLVCGFGSLKPALAQRYWDTDGALAGSTSNTTAGGTWGINSYWTTSASGGIATTAWVPGQQAIFSAGSDASGTFTVNVSGNQLVSGIIFQEGTVNLSGGTLTLTNGIGADTINVATARIATIDSILAGTNGMSKSGTGTLYLDGANTYSGTTMLTAGTIYAGNDFAFGSSAIDFAGGTVAANGASRTLANTLSLTASSTIGGTQALDFTGNFSQTGNRTLTINNTGTTTFSGSAFALAEANKTRTLTLNVAGGDALISGTVQDGAGSGADGLTKTGAGTLTLTGNNTFSGTLSLNAGTLVLGTDTAAGKGTLAFGNGATIAGLGSGRTITNNLTFGGNVTFAGSTPLTFSHSFSLGGSRIFTVSNVTTFTGVISGAADMLTKDGSGQLILGGTSANTFSGGLTVDDGLISAAKTNAFGTGPLVVNGGTVDFGAYSQNVGSVTLAGGSISGSGSLNASSYQLQSGTVNVQLGSAASVTKSSGGTVIISKGNNYNGPTVVSGGTLVVNNTTGSATGTNIVTVNSGGTLGGSGTILGKITLNSGATIAPGNSPGTLHTVSETWQGGSTYQFQMNDVGAGAGTGWDLVDVNGTLTLNTAVGNVINIDLTSLTTGDAPGNVANFDPSHAYDWTIIQTTGGIVFAAGGNEDTDFQIELGNFLNSLNGGSFSLDTSNGGKNLDLKFTPVPEPSPVALCAIGFGYLFIGRRYFKRTY